MFNSRRSPQYRRASRRVLCETLEPRLFLAADLFTFAPVVSFQTHPSGNQPQGLVVDSAGILYGVTAAGGAKNYGTVFKIAPGDSTPTVLASFTGIGNIGIKPRGDLYLDSATGFLYGTTVGGGDFLKGTVFKIDVSGTASTSTIATVASFNGTNGSYPTAGLVADGSGNLFGTALGATTRGYASTVWTIAANDISHTITSLATFNPRDLLTGQLATTPDGLLATDADGHIFGTTRNGGARKLGTLFQVNTDHSVTTLANLSATTGTHATGTLIRQSDGTFIGTTLNGGHKGYGTLFQFSTASGAAVIATFTSRNGAHPLGKIILDSHGNIFGVTATGGAKNYGTVFEHLAGSGDSIQTVYALSRQRDGLNPTTLVVDSTGNFFISTFAGGTKNAGAIFELRADNTVFAAPPAPNVITPAAVQLHILQQPTAEVAANQPLSLKVDVRDAHGNLAVVDGTVTLSITSGPAGGTFAGSPTATLVHGIATFSDLSLTLPGIYTLLISAPPLLGVVSTIGVI
jgi:uncharacterized repeat protein (TIGR03803 family)